MWFQHTLRVVENAEVISWYASIKQQRLIPNYTRVLKPHSLVNVTGVLVWPSKYVVLRHFDLQCIVSVYLNERNTCRSVRMSRR